MVHFNFLAEALLMTSKYVLDSKPSLLFWHAYFKPLDQLLFSSSPGVFAIEILLKKNPILCLAPFGEKLNRRDVHWNATQIAWVYQGECYSNRL